MQNFVLLTIRTTYPLAPPVTIYSADLAKYDINGICIGCVDGFNTICKDDLIEISEFLGAPSETFIVVENNHNARDSLDAVYKEFALPPLSHILLDPRQFGVPLEWFPRFIKENREQVLETVRKLSKGLLSNSPPSAS